MKYAVFLRGINVGGHKKVPMAELREMFAKIGFQNVKTLLNSGNVVFEADPISVSKLVEKIGKTIEKTFGFSVSVMARKLSEIQTLAEKDPFENVKTDKDTRLYMTMLPKKAQSDLPLPYISEKSDFKILKKTDREVFSVLDLKNARSVDAMAFLEKEYGKNVTTRNWNTVLKIANL